MALARRTLLACAASVGVARPGSARPDPVRAAVLDQGEWAVFAERFITAEGRVVDTGNGGVSHSEGQGWGMLLAVAADDAPMFDRLLGWTASHLRRRADALHAWKYVPGAGVPVPDDNNATDGDLAIGAALWRAGQRWGRPDHLAVAGAIGRDILRLLVREAGGSHLLLPGATGFERPLGLTVNPSSYAFPLLAELGRAAPSPLWHKVERDGLVLLNRARFGRWGLPPDWVCVAADGAVRPDPEWPPRFSFDAIRVPLYLAWAGRADTPVAAACRAWWRRAPGPGPAWVDVVTGAEAPYPAPPGIVAVAQLLAGEGGFPAVRTSPDYYSAALTLLCRLARQEGAAG